MSLIPFAPFTQGYSQRPVEDCQADGFRVRLLQVRLRAKAACLGNSFGQNGCNGDFEGQFLGL
jgi:hypothetical protein